MDEATESSPEVAQSNNQRNNSIAMDEATESSPEVAQSNNQSINQSRLMRLKIDLRSLLTQLQPGPYNGTANHIHEVLATLLLITTINMMLQQGHTVRRVPCLLSLST